jgi:cell cycle checkpoint protein
MYVILHMMTNSTRFSDYFVPCRCCMRRHRLMRPFSGFIFTKIIHNTVLALNNAVRSSITSVGQIAMDRRMWVLSSGALVENADSGDQWYDANPHTFHMLALGTLHSLPSPVQRTGQLICKPEFFGALRREQAARDALERTSSWLSSVRSLHDSLPFMDI